VTAAIMQPTFLPWLGYFALIEKVDVFIFLDNVQFDKRSWQQRNRYKTAQGVKWMTVPVLSKGKYEQEIREVEIDRSSGFPGKLLETLRHEYRKTPHFAEVFPWLQDQFSRLDAWDWRLGEMNMALIQGICGRLGLRANFRRASELPAEGAKAERLYHLCRAVGASRYVSPPGSSDYLEESTVFQDHGIPVDYFQYEHPVYAQPGDAFESHLSIIDLMFNVGAEAASFVRAGIR